MREFSSVDRIFGYFDASQRDINDKRLPDHVLPDGNCCLASHTGVNWSLCRSGILYETQGAGCSPRRSVHAGGHRCVAV